MRKQFLLWLAICCGAPACAHAMVLISPGDSGQRHDIELLADAGLIGGPVSTWPIPWAQLAADLDNLPEDKTYSPAVAGALSRIRAQLRSHERSSGTTVGVFARGGTDPQFLRTFDDTPRARAETGGYLDFVDGHFAGRLQFTYAADPDDNRQFRADGSWVGVALGNWMLALGEIDRYWGPAWQGGLIIGNNARPRPGVTLRRLRTTAFASPWLRWIGPWNVTFFAEKLEDDRVGPNNGIPGSSNAILTGMRVAFKPFQSLEIGLSRTAQFGGSRYNVNFGTLADVAAGTTNQTNTTIAGGKDINELAGGDFRWKLPYVNAAVYGEFIGEDLINAHPAKVLGQGGLEVWGGFGDSDASWRLVFETADTEANLFGAGHKGIAYNNFNFPAGYRYFQRSVGYPADGDALIHSLRAVLVPATGQELRLVLEQGKLNRGGNIRNPLIPNQDIETVDFGYAIQLRFARVDLGLGATHRGPSGSQDTKVHGWLGLSREF